MTVSVNIPEELYQRAREIAESQHLSVDDVVSSAFAGQLAAWERLKQRATRGSRESFLVALDKVPDVNLKNTPTSERCCGASDPN